VPYGPLSGITELTFSKLEATTQNISGENLAEGGGQTRVYTMRFFWEVSVKVLALWLAKVDLGT